MADRYLADLARMEGVVTRMGGFGAQVDEWLAEVSGEIDRLQMTWDGEAAAAQQVDHERWAQSMGEAHAVLASLRAVVKQARTNYSRASAANKAMWD